MILSRKSIKYFQSLYSRILQTMAKHQAKNPYLIKGDNFFKKYECLLSVWTQTSSIKWACANFNIPRSSFHEVEKSFEDHVSNFANCPVKETGKCPPAYSDFVWLVYSFCLIPNLKPLDE